MQSRHLHSETHGVVDEPLQLYSYYVMVPTGPFAGNLKSCRYKNPPPLRGSRGTLNDQPHCDARNPTIALQHGITLRDCFVSFLSLSCITTLDSVCLVGLRRVPPKMVIQSLFTVPISAIFLAWRHRRWQPVSPCFSPLKSTGILNRRTMHWNTLSLVIKSSSAGKVTSSS